MTAIIFDKASYGRGERQALEWVAAHQKWRTVKVTRKSAKPFDLNIEGTKLSGVNGQPIEFKCWLVLACLHVFWQQRLTVVPFNDWQYAMARPEGQNWRAFETTYAVQATKKSMVPMFSQRFISAVWQTWEAISPDAGRCTNAEAIELVLDADRLTSFVGEWADDEFTAAQEEHGYEKAAAELARLVKLV